LTDVKRLPVLAVVLTLAAVAAAPAGAAPRLVAPTEAIGNPTFAGNEIVYAAEGPRGAAIIRAVGPHGTVRLVRRLPNVRAMVADPFDDGFGFTFDQRVELRGTPSALGIRVRVLQGDRYSSTIEDRIFGGPAGAPLPYLYSHCLAPSWQRGVSPVDNAIDADGRRIAFVRETCDQSGPVGLHVVVRDALTGAETVGPATATREVRLAGRYVAYRPAPSVGSVSVYDIDAGQVVNTVETSAPRFDVQADGKLALGPLPGRFGYEFPCSDVVWFSPGDQTPHKVADCNSALVAIDGDHIALMRQEPSGQAAVVTLGGATREIRAPAPIAVEPDLRGSRLVYATMGCSADTGAVWVDDGTGAPQPGAALPECTVRAPRGPLKLDRKGVVQVPVTCPTGCRGSFAMSLSGGTNRPLGGVSAFQVPARGTRRFPITIGRLESPFNGHRWIPVRIEIRINKRSGVGYVSVVKVVRVLY
jgi:hypothetical protein